MFNFFNKGTKTFEIRALGLNEIDFLFSFHYAVAPCCQEVPLFSLVPFYVTARIKNSKSIYNKGKIKLFKELMHVSKLLI